MATTIFTFGMDAPSDTIQSVTLAAYEQYADVMPHWKMYRQYQLATLEEQGPEARIVAERNGAIIGSVLLIPPRPTSTRRRRLTRAGRRYASWRSHPRSGDAGGRREVQPARRLVHAPACWPKRLPGNPAWYCRAAAACGMEECT